MPTIIDLPLSGGEQPDAAAWPAAVGNEGFLSAVAGGALHIHHRSVTSAVAGGGDFGPGQGPEPTWSLLLRAVHQCFAEHLPLSLSPDVLWYAVVHEIAVHVRLNSEQYAGLFTDTPGRQQTIEVHDDSLLGPDPDWAGSIRLVEEPLRERLGREVVDLLQATFSTTTPDEVSASLVALMDVVSPYYRFRWVSSCGIPQIRLEGEAGDWRLLAERVRGLEGWFDGLRPWFADLHPVLSAIADTAGGGPVDQDFWRSLYKWKSMSGGDFVSGWITALFAHTWTEDGPRPKDSFDWRGRRDEGPTQYQENAFPSHVSRVPFRWQRPDATLDMIFLAGVLGVERDGDYLRPRLGHAVVEIEPAAPTPDDPLAAAQLPPGCWASYGPDPAEAIEGL